MAISRGKVFERQFKNDWEKTGSFIYRLPDQQTGYMMTSANLCDFICYHNPFLFLIECKSRKGNTFSLQEFHQYARMKKYAGCDRGIFAGVVLWFIEHDRVLYVPISTFTALEAAGKKSFNVKDIGSREYPSVNLPSIKKRTYMSTDYEFLLKWAQKQ